MVNHLKASGITVPQNTNIEWKHLDEAGKKATVDFITNLQKSLTPGKESLLHSLSEDLTSLPASTRSVLQPILASLSHLHQKSKASSVTTPSPPKSRPIWEQNAQKVAEEKIGNLLENAKNPKLTKDEIQAYIKEAKAFLTVLNGSESKTKTLRIHLEVLVGNLTVRAGGGAKNFKESYMLSRAKENNTLKHAVAQDVFKGRK
jgi:hypothetical protein